MPNQSFFYCLLFFVIACGKSTSQNKLKFISKTIIEVPEPSGLTYHDGSLFVVSDEVPYLYRLSLNGRLEQKYHTKVKDMEGVVYDKSTESFILLSELKRSITYYSLDKGVGKIHKIKGKQHSKNKGLEGICYHSKKQSLYVVNEARPKQLLKISRKGKIKKKYDLKFAKDISGMVYDAKLDVFWVLSDESQALYKVNSKGKKLQKIPLEIKKPEGVCIDRNRRLYIVSDLTSELFIYQLE
ncbi:SdiA-regulated domain-containing protein [Flavicella sp.]|uniref:SdiA-regulated domain-containing protein n=1 Tax=Flavicella sp. TaxID=2957742 RepID=UPI00301B1577